VIELEKEKKDNISNAFNSGMSAFPKAERFQ
jgi:hypothetical protein